MFEADRCVLATKTNKHCSRRVLNTMYNKPSGTSYWNPIKPVYAMLVRTLDGGKIEYLPDKTLPEIDQWNKELQTP